MGIGFSLYRVPVAVVNSVDERSQVLNKEPHDSISSRYPVRGIYSSGAPIIAEQTAESLGSFDHVRHTFCTIRAGKQQDIAFPLMVALTVKWDTYSAIARRSDPSPNRISLRRHSSFADRTQRSAKAFKFGLRGGKVRHFAPSDSRIDQKVPQNLVSRSCNMYRWFLR